MNNELKESLSLIGQGFKKLGKLCIGWLNTDIHKHPYPYIGIVIVIMSFYHFTTIVHNRMNNDKVDVISYNYQKSIDSLKVLVEHYEYEEQQSKMEKESNIEEAKAVKKTKPRRVKKVATTVNDSVL